MITIRFRDTLFLLLLALSLLLAGCAPQAEPEPSDAPVSSEEATPESSAEENSEALQEAAKKFREEVEAKMPQEYDGKLDFEHETVQKTLNAAKNNERYQRYFAEEPEEGLAEVRRELDALLPFRSEGSLIGPKAPPTYAAACDYIRAEFDGFITEAGRDEFETVLTNMEQFGSTEVVAPYADSQENAQRNFDAARRYLWDKYGCDIESNTYFLQNG